MVTLKLWTQVLGYLSPTDRLRVRAVCKNFRDLVDGSGLWRTGPLH
uniref:F-box domain-containing protein n=1 Tax=Neogobius melanostomus TaxID=47308 RepID=A0A8C6UF06_9GOBI